MSEEKMMRLSQVARKLNVGRTTIVDFLSKKGFEVDSSPNSKVTPEQYNMLAKEFASSASEKREASGLTIGHKRSENVVIESEPTEVTGDEEENILIKSTSVDKTSDKSKEAPKPEKIEHEKPKLQGIKVVGKIDLEKGPKKEEPAKEEPKKEEPKKEEQPKAKEEPKKEE
ncbi:MAG: translation initiation factor IF-2, partial [Candidatus Cyclobacteriaceae bacterium M2_1C_046]